jgi:spoIIIJ-associated protein
MVKLTKIQKIIIDFFEKMGVKITTERKEVDDSLEVNLLPKDDQITSLLIGYKGENLQAIQHMLRILTRKKLGNAQRLVIDINGYRARQMDFLKEMVVKIAERVKKNQRVELLRPMTAYERRIVHLMVQEISGLATQSVGEEPNRRVIIRPEE